jgi:hypothetical protein
MVGGVSKRLVARLCGMMKLSDYVTLFAHFTLPNSKERWLPADLARKDSPHLDGYVWGIGFWIGKRLDTVVETYSRQEAAVFLLDCGGWNEAEAKFLEGVANECEHVNIRHVAYTDTDYCLDCRKVI